MEPEAHRLDREAMLAEHLAVAERLQQEVDEMDAAAAEKRRAYIERFVEKLRVDARAQSSATAPAIRPDGEAGRLLVASARAAEDVRETSRVEALRTLTKARELSAFVDAQTERERAALAEIQERREQVERDAEELLAETERVEVEMQARRARAEREAAELLAGARAEADRVLAVAEEERRVQAEREAEERLAETRAEADRIAAELEERRKEVAHKADELRARVSEADRIFTAAEEERQRVRTLLAGAIASLDVDAKAGPPSESLVGDLGSRQHDMTEPTGT